jgi:hypothetical protein
MRGIKTQKEGILLAAEIFDYVTGRGVIRPLDYSVERTTFFTSNGNLQTQEQALWAAVLRQAIFDLDRTYEDLSMGTIPPKGEWVEAVDFFGSKHFEIICAALELDPDRLLDFLVVCGALRDTPKGYQPKGRLTHIEESIKDFIANEDRYRNGKEFEAANLDKVTKNRSSISAAA